MLNRLDIFLAGSMSLGLDLGILGWVSIFGAASGRLRSSFWNDFWDHLGTQIVILGSVLGPKIDGNLSGDALGSQSQGRGRKWTPKSPSALWALAHFGVIFGPKNR